MNIEEKRKEIRKLCDKFDDCSDCRLNELTENYHSMCGDLPEPMVDRIYSKFIDKKDSTPAVNTCVLCEAEIPEGRMVCPNCENKRGCDNCAHTNLEPNEEPCVTCKYNMNPTHLQFESAPLNWKPRPEIVIPVGHEFFNFNAFPADPIKPEYYNDTKITPFDVIDDWDLNFYLGNAVKYIKRAGKKAGNSRLQDLKKVREYIDHEIRAEELNK